MKRIFKLTKLIEAAEKHELCTESSDVEKVLDEAKEFFRNPKNALVFCNILSRFVEDNCVYTVIDYFEEGPLCESKRLSHNGILNRDPDDSYGSVNIKISYNLLKVLRDWNHRMETQNENS